MKLNGFGLLGITMIGLMGVVNGAPTQQSNSATATAPVRLRLTHVYVQEPGYLCSVYNESTGRTFFGRSPKLSLAEVYARTTCQMISYKGACYVKTHCREGMVLVRRRRFIRVNS